MPLFALALLGASVQPLPAAAQASQRQKLEQWAECMWTNHRKQAEAYANPKFAGAIRNAPGCDANLLRNQNADRVLSSLRAVPFNRLDACILRNPKVVALLNAPRATLTESQRAKFTAHILDGRRATARGDGKDPSAIDTKVSDSDIEIASIYAMPMPKEVSATGKRCDSKTWKIVAKRNATGAGSYLVNLARKAK